MVAAHGWFWWVCWSGRVQPTGLCTSFSVSLWWAQGFISEKTKHWDRRRWGLTFPAAQTDTCTFTALGLPLWILKPRWQAHSDSFRLSGNRGHPHRALSILSEEKRFSGHCWTRERGGLPWSDISRFMKIIKCSARITSAYFLADVNGRVPITGSLQASLDHTVSL